MKGDDQRLLSKKLARAYMQVYEVQAKTKGGLLARTMGNRKDQACMWTCGRWHLSRRFASIGEHACVLQSDVSKMHA